MRVLLTGAAGFIGFHTTMALLDRGDEVIGIDNLNDYYDPSLKEARLAQLQGRPGFTFHRIDIADQEAMQDLGRTEAPKRIVHLAAQAGVRYSLKNPRAYVRANVTGHLEVLELARNVEGFEHLVYASTSSVYGANNKLPFSEHDRTDNPITLYAATKRADELMSHAYSHLYRIPQTGLRFFTVYGPWGRPDMAMYTFAKAILEGRTISVFNHGDMQRDFTYVDDIVKGVIATLDDPPADDGVTPPARIFNIGNNKPESLQRLIGVLEGALGRPAIKEYLPMQPGDVKATYADIEAISSKYGFEPSTPIDVGVPKFVAWFREFYNI